MKLMYAISASETPYLACTSAFISKIAPCLFRLFYLLVFPQELSSFLDPSCSNFCSFYNLFGLWDIAQRARPLLLHAEPAHRGTELLHAAWALPARTLRKARAPRAAAKC